MMHYVTQLKLCEKCAVGIPKMLLFHLLFLWVCSCFAVNYTGNALSHFLAICHFNVIQHSKKFFQMRLFDLLQG